MRFVTIQSGERRAALAVDAVLGVQALRSVSSRSSLPFSRGQERGLLETLGALDAKAAARPQDRRAWVPDPCGRDLEAEGLRLEHFVRNIGSRTLSRGALSPFRTLLRRWQVYVPGNRARSATSQERGGASSYLDRIEGTAPPRDELRELARELTVGETYFFRHAAQFRAFADVALADCSQPSQNGASCNFCRRAALRATRRTRSDSRSRARSRPDVERRHPCHRPEPGRARKGGRRAVLRVVTARNAR